MKTKELLEFLDRHSIEYEYLEHQPVYTSEEARRLIPERPGASAKNLFLRNKKGNQHYLFVCDDLKTSDLKDLAAQVGESRLSLASPARLKKHLGLDPGAVSLLALVNDSEHHVQVLMDEDLWEKDKLQCHPLTNTATLIIPLPDIKRFLHTIGHKVQLVII